MKTSGIKIPYRKSKNGIVIEVKVEARSSQRGITGTMENALKVKLTSPPVEGAANEQLIEVISEATGFNKNRIRIIRGASSKRKLVEIEGATEIR